MFWLRRPPYLRWLAAALILAAGLAFDMRPTSSTPYPFIGEHLLAGQRITTIEWRDVATGLLPGWDRPVSGVAVAELQPGTPLLPSLLAEETIPAGWWAVSLPLPARVSPGTPIRVTANGRSADGMAVGEITDTGFALTGTVAFPPAVADQVAAMAVDSALVVMVGSREPIPGTDG